jgi:hypothetical protein
MTVQSAAAQTLNPYVSLILPVLTLVLGAVLTYVFRERSAQNDRAYAREADTQRWARQERRTVYAKFIAANDGAFNAAATAERIPGSAGGLRLTRDARERVEGAFGEAITLLAEVQLLSDEQGQVVKSARELVGFHQQMVRAALEDGSRIPNASAQSNELTLTFVSAARNELAGA